MCATLLEFFKTLDEKSRSQEIRLRRNWVLRLWKHVTKAGIQDDGDTFQIWFEYLPNSRFEIQQLRTDDFGLSPSFNLLADHGKLAVDHLWIDALCIVQDDEQDRITEIANMGQIYENAYLTIAASSAKGSDDGFLEPNICPFFTAPVRLPNGENMEAHWVPYGRGLIDSHMYTPARGGKTKPVRDVEPLHHRGWTFQEALLSKRILLFSTFQPYYICQKSSRAGGEPSPEKFLTAVDLYDTLSAHTDHSGKPLLGPDSDSGLKWLHRAENYSRRILSVLDDKILAIHAVKEQYLSTQGVYFAGVWSNNLAANLLWSTMQRHPRSPSELDRFASAYKKGRITTLPSWSWLSFDGSVRFEVVWHALYLRKIDSLSAIFHHIRIISTPQADIFGRLTESPLRLAGRVKQVLVIPPKGNGWMNRIQERSCYDAGVWDSESQTYKIDTAGDSVLEHRIGEAIFDGYTEVETQCIDRPAHPEFHRGEDWEQTPILLDCLLVSTAGNRVGDLSLGRRPRRYGFKGEGNEVAYGLLLVSEGVGKSGKCRVGLFRGDEGFAAHFDDAQEQEFDFL
ncbi:hypothetical protein E8E14_000594 [Neopestalotiopsis sp. 37M]|nr:hypothetical protein E8E14_000594 [Neopestalotiopsis sp. 37M]